MASDNVTDIHKVLEKIRELIGDKPHIEVAKFTNWAGTEVREAILAVTPTTVEEVQSVVRAARDLRLRVRAAGLTHSWTPLFSDEGDIVMYMKDLQRPDGNKQRTEVFPDPDDPNRKLVTVASGVTTGEFRDVCLDNGVCIPSNVVLRDVQIGGVVAPACHGVGWDTQSVSDKVVSMRIVDSSGDLKTYSMKDDPDMMKAVQCNLGLWGIMVDLTLRVDHMVMVETTNKWMKVNDLFYNKETLQKLVHENWSVEIFWFPFNGVSISKLGMRPFELDVSDWKPEDDEVWIRLVNKANPVGHAKGESYYTWNYINEWMQAKGFDLVDNFIVDHPYLTPFFLKAQVEYLKLTTSKNEEVLTQGLPHAIHFRSNIHEMHPARAIDWSFNVDEDLTAVYPAIKGVIGMVNEAAKKGSFPLNLTLEMRFIADSDVYMAPYSSANTEYDGTGHSCAIEMLSMGDTPGWEDFSQEVAALWQTLPGARTHWCKEWSHIKDIDNIIRASYSEMMPKYLSALERSGADPDGIFFNKRLEKIFYPDGHPGSANGEVINGCQE